MSRGNKIQNREARSKRGDDPESRLAARRVARYREAGAGRDQYAGSETVGPGQGRVRAALAELHVGQGGGRVADDKGAEGAPANAV